MRIDPSETLIGYSKVVIRDLLKKLVFDRVWVEQFLKVSAEEAERVMSDLGGAGLICPLRQPGMEGKWETTPDGTRLANATTLPSISRDEATRILESFLARVGEVRGNDAYLYEVWELVLFGSYLRGAEQVNDVDLVVRLRTKQKFSRDFGDVLADKLQAARAAGKTFPQARNWYAYLQSEVMDYLQQTSPYVSFHRPDVFKMINSAAERQKQTGADSDIVHDTTHKIIYRAGS